MQKKSTVYLRKQVTRVSHITILKLANFRDLFRTSRTTPWLNFGSISAALCSIRWELFWDIYWVFGSHTVLFGGQTLCFLTQWNASVSYFVTGNPANKLDIWGNLGLAVHFNQIRKITTLDCPNQTTWVFLRMTLTLTILLNLRKIFQDALDTTYNYTPDHTTIPEALGSCCSKWGQKVKTRRFWWKVLSTWIPFVSWIRKYRWKSWFLPDMIGGLTVGIMNIPQGF